MNTKNQAELNPTELPISTAANEDGFAPAGVREVGQGARGKQAWSPLEVWRTRVKASSTTLAHGEPLPL